MSYELCRISAMASNRITGNVTADRAILLIKCVELVAGQSAQNTDIRATVTGQTLFNKRRYIYMTTV